MEHEAGVVAVWISTKAALYLLQKENEREATLEPVSMAYNEKIADRIREIIAATHKNVEEKKMFGGLCFMVNDKMCIGVEKDRLMLRFDPARNDEIMMKEGCKPMDFTGKIMKGYVFVDTEVLTTRKRLDYWVQLALEYNKIAKSSKKPATKKRSKNKRHEVRPGKIN